MAITKSSLRHSFKNGFVPGQPDTNIILEFKREREGSDNPNYKSQIRDGENATTPLKAFEEVLKGYYPAYLSGLYDDSTRFSTYRVGTVIQIPTHDQSEMANLVDRAKAQALARAYNKIREKQTAIDSQVLLGEFKETIRLLKNPLGQSLKLAKTLTSAIKAKKGKHIQRANADFVKALSGEYLEFRFGVIPLIYDSISILELAQKIAERKNVMTYRFYGEAETSTLNVVTKDVVDGTFSVDHNISVISKAQYIVRYGIVEKLLNDLSGSLQTMQRNVLDFTLLPTTLWELTYASWLVDYLVNANDILQAATTSTSILGWQSSTLIRETTYLDVAYQCYTSNSHSKIESFVPGFVKTSLRDVERVGTQLEIPPVVFHLPGSDIKYLNIAAFLAQKIL